MQQWEAHRIVEVYRKRWSGTETFHRDGKLAARLIALAIVQFEVPMSVGFKASAPASRKRIRRIPGAFIA